MNCPKGVVNHSTVTAKRLNTLIEKEASLAESEVCGMKGGEITLKMDANGGYIHPPGLFHETSLKIVSNQLLSHVGLQPFVDKFRLPQSNSFALSHSVLLRDIDSTAQIEFSALPSAICSHQQAFGACGALLNCCRNLVIHSLLPSSFFLPLSQTLCPPSLDTSPLNHSNTLNHLNTCTLFVLS